MAVKGGMSQACAACKYQRRKCSPDCPLAPYFPPDQPKQFQNAHRLFGVSNILKILNKLDPSQKEEAMRSIVYESNVRDRYPIHGCLGIIYTLHLQIQQAQLELDAANAQLSLHHHHFLSSTSPQPSHLQLASNANQYNNNNYLPFDTISAGISLADSSNTNNNNNNTDMKNVDALWAMNNLVLGEANSLQMVATNEYDEVSPYLDNTDDRQSYIDSKEAYESSSESSVKDTMQSMEHVTENELKSAAACFTLTSIVN